MIVTVEINDAKATIESGEVQAIDCLGMCIAALIGVGFHADSMRQAVAQMADEMAQEGKQ